MKVLIINGNNQYTNMFLKHGWEVVGNDPYNKIRVQDVDLVQFTGGEDVTPALYGDINTDSYNNEARDLYEAGVFAIAQRLCKPMAGICRGGQFLNVMCGGSMIQHVEGHATDGTHDVRCWLTGRHIRVTSTHHQMMVCSGTADLIATAGIVGNFDPEVLHYDNQNVLCFQPHPEYGYKECEDYYFDLLDRCLGLKV